MQYLKPELREKIFESATKEFYVFGYKDANMRRIAKNARITVGNIYRYFSSKAHLLDCVVKDTYDEILELINSSNSNLTKLDEINISVEKLIQIFIQNHDVIVILLMKSQGSKYENIIDVFKQAIIKRIQYEFPSISNDISEVITEGIVSGLIHILQKYPNDNQKMQSSLHDMIMYLFVDLEKRIEGIE